MDDSLADKTKEAVDSVAGAGTSDKVEGNVQEAIGQGKQAVGEAIGNDKMKAEGSGDELAGKAKEVMGEVKEHAEDFGEKVHDVIEDVAEKVKEGVGHMLDSVKHMLDHDKKPETAAGAEAPKETTPPPPASQP